jgi:5'-3' exonuclease
MPENEKFNVIIFDIYNLYYKAVWIEQERVIYYKDNKIHTEGIIGTINLIEKYIKRFATPEYKLYFLFDNAKTTVEKYRKELSEAYKKKRQVQPDWFYAGLDYLEHTLKNYMDNAYIYRIKHLEADDYVENIINIDCSSADKVLLISEDMDWSKSLKANVFQFMKKKIYGLAEFEEEFGFPASYKNICFYKTFYGDDSDNIAPGLREFPKMFFLNIIENSESLYDFFIKAKNGVFQYLDKGWIERIRRDQDLLVTNWKLVESVNLKEAQLKEYRIKCKFNKDKLTLLYEALSLPDSFDKRVERVYNVQDKFFEDFMFSGEVRKK